MRALIVVGLLAIAAPARAQPDEAWAAYDAAFGSLVAGDREAARAQLETLATTWPDHPAASRARARLDELGVARPASSPSSDDRRPSRVARGELALGMTVTGVLAGVELCAPSCDNVRSQAAAVMIGGGGALAGALLLPRAGVHSGEAQLYNSAATWGRWNALGINDGFSETTSEAVISVGAQAAGIGLGVGLWRVLRPTSGDVALANSALLWGSAMTLFGSIAANREPSMRTIVLAGDLFLIAGAALASETRMSRGRTLLIDAGGVLGALLGGLIVAGTADEDDRVIGATMMVTTALGLGIATAATWRWDDPPSVAP